MGLPAEAKARLANLVRRETITLPDLGIEIVVRGMMFGEKERVADLTGFKQSATMIALTVEDASGKPMWNPNSLDDQSEIAALSLADSNAIAEAISRLSGQSKEGKDRSGETENSPSPLSDSESAADPSASSASE